MATEKLNFNGLDAGWEIGVIADVDEAVASADGLFIGTVTKNQTTDVDLTDSVVEDADTVTALDIVVRARTSGSGADSLGVELLIDGSVVGARQDQLLTASFVDYTFSDVAWDADKTAAQMDGAQVRLHARQSGMPTAAGHEVDCGDVDVVFTVGGGITLVVQDSDHLHDADNLDLVQANVLAVNDADHLHDAENIVLELPSGSPIITPASITTLDTTSQSGDLLDVTLSASGNDRILVIANLVKDNTATAADVTSITVDAGGVNRTIGAGVVLQGTRQVAQESTFSNQVEIYFVLEADLPTSAGEIDIDIIMDSPIDSNYWVAFEITGCPDQAFDAIVQNFTLDDVAADVQFDESITPTVDDCLIVDFWSISHSATPVFTNAETLVAEMKDANGSIVVTQFTQGSAAAKTMAHEIDTLSQRRAWNVISFAPGGDTVLAVDDADHLHDAELLALIQANVLAMQDADHLHDAELLVLIQANVLALQDADHLNVADNVALIQANVLAMNDSDHLHDAENLVLDVGVILVVADSDHLHDAENLDLVQANILTIAEAFSTHVAENLDLTQANILAIADADHLHDAENLVLDVSVTLIVDDSDHLHTADNLDLLQANILAIAEAFSAHVADNLDLIQANVLDVDDADHLHDAENLVLTVSITLIVADSDHVHTGDNVDLVQASILAINDAFHDHIADNLDLISGLTIIVSDAVHQVVSDNINLFDPLATLPEGIVFTIDGKDRVFVINTKDRVFVILPSNRV